MTIKRDKARYIYAMLALLLLIMSVIGGRYKLSAFADKEQYTSVTTDLCKDATFDIDAYPSDTSDYSIQVIQIAESESGELLVYTYQPSGASSNVFATEISIATDIVKPEWRLYPLTCVSAEATLFKYTVGGLTVTDVSTRYYNISEILRPFIYGIDKGSGTDGIKNAVAYPVAVQYKATTENGSVIYSYEKTDVVEIKDPYAGFLEYFNGYKFCSWSHCHSHFVAFSTDWQIDYLKEADVTYYSQKCYYHYSFTSGGWTSKDDPEQGFKTVKGVEIGSNEADGFLGKKYEWARIQTVTDFVKTEKLTDTMKNNVTGKQWVLRFLETPYVEKSIGVSSSDSWTEVSNVTVLRLEFFKNGRLYNLGTVADKVTGSGKPGNINTDEIASLFEWLERVTGVPQWFWIMLAVLIPLAVLLPVLSLVFPVFGQVLKTVFGALWTGVVWLLKGLLWLVLLPFKRKNT